MSTKPFTPEYYNDDEGLVRWRVRGANGKIIDAASEGFANLHKAFDNYTLGQRGKQVTYEEAKEQHDHTGDSGASEGSESDEDAIEGEEADAGEGARGSEAGGSGEDDSDQGTGSSSPKG